MTVAVPAPLSCTVIFLQIAFGRSVSETMTEALQVDVFPLTSVAVRVTMFAPRLEQLNTVGFADKDKIPQASLVALLI